MTPQQDRLTFAHPWALLVTLVLAVLVALRHWQAARSSVLLGQVVAPRLREQILAGLRPWRRKLKFWLIIVALVSLTVAGARPQWGFVELPVTRRGLDVIVALDTSRSMLAEDVEPSRLERAKFAIQDLMESLRGDRIGLVCFAGDAFLQCPLVTDYNAFKLVLEEVNTNLLPTGGTNLARAIQEALKGFHQSEGDSRALLLITDGEELDEDGIAAARQAKDKGARVFTIGFGTAEGSKIFHERNGRREVVRDASGQEVVSKLDEARLRQVAEAGGGTYFRFEGAKTIRELIAQGFSAMQRQDIDTRERRRPIEAYQLPLAFGFALFLMGVLFRESPNRRRLAAAAALLLGAGFTVTTGLADEAEELYSRKEYGEAQRAYVRRLERENGNRDKLAFSAGAAAYKAGDFGEAARLLGQAIATDDPALRAKARYNLGNTFFRMGEAEQSDEEKRKALWKSAVNEYREAERAETSISSNAAHNRGVVERRLRQMEKKEDQQKQDQQKQDGQNDQQKQDQQKQDGRNDQQKQDQQKQDQQKQDQQKQDGQNDQQKQDRQKQGGQNDQQKQDQQKQDGQNDQQKQDQQKQDGQNDQQKQDQQKQGGQNDQQKQDQQKQDGQNDQQKQDQQKQGGQRKPEEKQKEAGKESDEGAKPEEGNNPDQAKKKGELKALNPANPDEKAAKDEPSAFELTPDGKMSAAAARAFLESLDSEEIQGQTMQRRAKHRVRVIRDW